MTPPTSLLAHVREHNLPIYRRGDVCMVCGDALELLPVLDEGSVDCVLTDPPYGQRFCSNMHGHRHETPATANRTVSIIGDRDTTVRDRSIELLDGLPMLVFGTWKTARPRHVRHILTWEKGMHLGMGDLSLPWKPNTEEIYVIGNGFFGHRGSSVISIDAPVSWASRGRFHVHEKPAELLEHLLNKCPNGTIVDPFMGSGTTAVACVNLNRACIAFEIHRPYFDIACKRVDEAFERLSLIEPPPPKLTQEELFV